MGLLDMQSNFSEAFSRANPDYQNGEGYGVDPPGQVCHAARLLCQRQTHVLGMVNISAPACEACAGIGC